MSIVIFFLVMGQHTRVKVDFKNFYAWLAFEETASQLAKEIEEAL